jgi:hypothetical protein
LQLKQEIERAYGKDLFASTWKSQKLVQPMPEHKKQTHGNKESER